MSKRQSLLFIGIFTLVLPFLGIPASWKTILTIIIGIGLIVVAYFMDKDEHGSQIKNTPEKRPNSASTFVESESDVVR